MAKERFGLPGECRRCSAVTEAAGWLLAARYLQTQGVANLVVDSASIEVKPSQRRAKTDRMDVGKLLTMLMRLPPGREKGSWSIVMFPAGR